MFRILINDRGRVINKRLRGCKPFTKMPKTTSAHTSVGECELDSLRFRESFSLQL